MGALAATSNSEAFTSEQIPKGTRKVTDAVINGYLTGQMHHEVLLATLGFPGDVIVETPKGTFAVADDIPFLSQGANC